MIPEESFSDDGGMLLCGYSSDEDAFFNSGLIHPEDEDGSFLICGFQSDEEQAFFNSGLINPEDEDGSFLICGFQSDEEQAFSNSGLINSVDEDGSFLVCGFSLNEEAETEEVDVLLQSPIYDRLHDASFDINTHEVQNHPPVQVNSQFVNSNSSNQFSDPIFFF